MNRRSFVALTGSPLLLGSCSRSREQNRLFAEHLDYLSRQIDQPATVVVQSTTFRLGDRLHDWKTSRDLQAWHPGLQGSTASDLLAVGHVPRSVELRDSRLPRLTIRQVTEAQVRDLFDGPSLTLAWEQFRRAFPNAASLLTFSNVGFNAQRNQAVFVLSAGCGGLCGSGQLVIMRRQPTGTWRTESSTNLWRS